MRAREPKDENARAVRKILESLDDALRTTFRIVDREELDRLGADPEAPFALAASPGYVLDDRVDGDVMQPNPGMSHGHHPDLEDMHTGFIAKGAGIRAGTVVPMMSLTDVAPLVAALLDLKFEARDGMLIRGLLS